MTANSFTVTVGRVSRELPTIEVGEMGRVPLVEFLGDVEFTNAVADELRALVPEDAEMLMSVSTTCIPLTHALSERTGLPYVIVRKKRRTYLRDPLIQEVQSMTLGVNETLWLDGRHAARLRGRRVVILTDVVSTGGTSLAMARLVERAGGQLSCFLSAFRQGEPGIDVKYLQELPKVL
ncbi:phosphoribosyltransferase family protein [Deinococcus peraridilitoris]|uniref:PRPP-binding protein, adenine/guanine phosphoribosyltransferase n=1 Tax=Deinococcus peraridilitoris (strain DSM 19664 / LMG 22246 / CIP 109416 / KR-200) TaxID=937777 RepID=L0A607_DEIPD|nr:phosphoribosyltransferase family protein [Deinococcus peraridilitoris]AFZ68884.1 PRPP-binding protein, adenine/guanine phosphoribosyltransferase [Deinococcus peraridilitoris DSM 19664]